MTDASDRKASSPTPLPGPLNGITVIDLSRILAGPYCTMILSDLGARVIKVESPEGDDARQFGPFVDGESAYFASLNRGKESLALNLKDETDRGLFERLLAKADVLVENFRPGTMERLGFGWESLHARFPSLIHAATSGFGQTGPYAGRPAYDMIVQAMGGMMSLTGEPGRPPVRVGTSIGDIAAALFTATGIASALYHRTRTGEGTRVDVGMLDCQVAILENALARYFATGTVPGPLGARHPSISPFEAFATKDGEIVIAAGNDGLFAKLCAALGRDDLPADPRFKTNAERAAHADALKAELEAVLTTRPAADWLTALEAAGVPCGPINNMDAVAADPQVRARNMIVTAETGNGAQMHLAGNPVKTSAFADSAERGPVPALDSARERILAEFGEP